MLMRIGIVIVLAVAGCTPHDGGGTGPGSDKDIRLTSQTPLVVGESGYGYVSDACSSTDDADCEDDVWVITDVARSGAVAGVYLIGGMVGYTAGIQSGSGTVTVTARSGSITATASASVEVRYPDDATVAPYCGSIIAHPAAPYLIAPSVEVMVTWRTLLEGRQHNGDTGEVLADAPLMTFVRKGFATAWFLAPATGDLIPVQSTLGDSSFEYQLYDPAQLVLAVDPYMGSGTPAGLLGFVTYAKIGGRATCDDAGVKTVHTETPIVCMLQESSTTPPTDTLDVDRTLFYVVPLTTGTCTLTITHGTVVGMFDLSI